MLLLSVVGAWHLFLLPVSSAASEFKCAQKNQQQLQVLEARFAFFTASSSLEQSTSIEVQSTKCKALVFPTTTTTIITLVVCTVIMLTSEVCTVTVHSVHSRAEKCSCGFFT